MWKNKLENKKFKKSRGGLLDEAIRVYFGLKRRLENIPDIVDTSWVRDVYGTIGLDSKEFIVVAKKYVYGDMVSVHKIIWDRAILRGKKILMYIKKNGYFYLFSPEKIKKTIFNKRGNTMMVNFGIRNGINIVKLAELKKIGDEMVVKNEKYAEKIQKKLI